MRAMRLAWCIVLWLVSAVAAWSQGPPGDRLRIATVERAPFSMQEGGQHTGFSLDLWAEIADELGLFYEIVSYETFPDMLRAVQDGEANAAVANISITAERETVMDFTQPIFSSGLQVMLPAEPSNWSMLRAALSPRLLLMVAGAAVGLLLLGMVMWLLERRAGVFGPAPRDAAFPAFWWSLNVLISGDYKEETPVTPMGRAFGTLMVVASLFVVSIFVANLTANMTINALGEDVSRLADLDGRRAGTTEGSTAALLMDARAVGYRAYPDLGTLLAAFHDGELDAVVFDGPILAWHVAHEGRDKARLVDRVFHAEYYGIALPDGASLREPINRTILRLEEDGTYAALKRKWFGAAYGDS